MEIEKIQSLIALLENSSLEEIEWTDGSIRLSKFSSKSNSDISSKAQSTTQSTALTQVSSQAHSSTSIQTPVKEAVQGEVIKSPMVGTFYRSSAPGAPAFIQVGDKVKKGQTLCIIEAMKTMNHLDADRDGEILDILVESGNMVEFDQELIIIG
ncbi:MAG: acetyl-CoA carboxylase biotin carboxyl carrier protein [Psittacicella sp.]